MTEATRKVIPAKRSSSRVPDKNYRPFAKSKSLLNILVEKLVLLGQPRDVYIFSEEESTRAIVDAYGET